MGFFGREANQTKRENLQETTTIMSDVDADDTTDTVAIDTNDETAKISPEQVEETLARLDTLFSGQLENLEMKLLYDTAVKFAREGKIRG